MKLVARRSLVIGALAVAATALTASVVEAQTAAKDEHPPTPDTTATPTPWTTKHSVTEQLLYTTVMMKTVDAKGNHGSGTASIVQLFSNQQLGLPVLLTNKHVVANAVSITIRLTRQKADGSPDQGNTEEITLDDMQNWLAHPDPTVDLTIYNFAGMAQKLQSEGRPIFFVAVDESLIPTEEILNGLSPLEDIIVVGYPDGISDSAHNIPVFRKGITASPASLDFDGKREFLIDAAIYPGSSGSPVFLYNHGTWLDAQGHIRFGTRVQLLGIVWGVRMHPQPGQIVVVPAPTQQAISLTGLPNNLGICIKAARILDFEPEIIKQGYKAPDGFRMRASAP